MFDFSVGIKAEPRYMSRYEVFCNRCDVSIGVMCFRTIREAIFNTLGRGGVLCPSCRANTCDVCGELVAAERTEMVEGPKGPARMCEGCAAEFVDLRREVVKAIVADPKSGFNWEDEVPF